MKKFLAVASLILIIFVCGMLCVNASNSIDGLNATSDLNQALHDAKDLNKSVVIVFDQDSCVYCEILKDEVLTNPDVQKTLNDKYIVVILDINQNYNVANKYKIYGTPTTVFVNSNGDEISRIEGYLPADQFLESIKGI